MARPYRGAGEAGKHGCFRYGAIAIVILGLALQLVLFDRSFVDMDEGHLLATADRMLRGDVLYRDVHTGIFPGAYGLTAALLGIFGHDAVVTRWAQCGVNVVVALVIWSLALRIARPRWAALAPLLFLATIPMSFPVWTMLNYSSLSLLFALAALLHLLRYMESARLRDGLLTGALLAACALTKQNFGALAGLVIAIASLWEWRAAPRSGRSTLGGLLPIVLGGAVPSLLTAGYFASQSAFDDLIRSTFTQLLGSQLADYDNPIPPILGALPLNDRRFLFQYLPPALFSYLVHGETILGLSLGPALQALSIRLSYGLPLLVLLATPFLLWRVGRIADVRERRGARATLLAAPILFLGIFPSAIWSHLAFVLPPLFLVVTLVADRSARRLRRRSSAAAKLGAGAATVLVLALCALALRVAVDIRRWHPVSFPQPRMSLSLSSEQAKLYSAAAEFIERCAPPGEPIFAAPVLPMLYFLTDRPNPTRYDLWIPGDVHSGQAIHALERTHTRCLVYDPRMYLEYPPFETLFPELARYIAGTYQLATVMRAGDRQWHGLVRKAVVE
jgi:4-amino-4-deoxy-L-arabinose transferase-like glycosyltransferase